MTQLLGSQYELAWWVFASAQLSRLEARAETAFPAGNNNPTVVCCHGISTEMLFLSRSSQQKSQTKPWTSLFVFFLIYCSRVYRRSLGF